jgi:hypothetical protein
MLKFEFFNDAELTIKSDSTKVTSNVNSLLVVDHTAEADYTVYI